MADAKGNEPGLLQYIDNLRLMIITFVVVEHLAVTYSGIGSWNCCESAALDTLSMIWFAFYLSFQQAYFMGLLFLLAGFFAERSYDRKGSGRFVGERFRCRVVPTLIFKVAITPFIEWVELGKISGSRRGDVTGVNGDPGVAVRSAAKRS
jgi:fucose 4-O-acetylase-like acetyltransferase